MRWRLTSSSSTELLQVGRIDRPHGLRGEVVVALTTDRLERVEPGSTLTTQDGRSLHIEASRPFQHRFIVHFVGVNSREDAALLHGATLLAAPIADDEVMWAHQLIGAAVFGIDDTFYGQVEALEANPASDLLLLEDGSLVPLRFVVSFEDDKIVIDPPAGLFELD